MELEDKIIDFLAGELPAQEKEELEQITKSDQEAKSILDEYKDIQEQIQREKLETPDLQWVADMTKRLSQSNSQAKVIQPFFSNSMIRKLAASAAVIIIGLLGFMNYQQGQLINRVDSDLFALRAEMRENLNQSSVSTRIKAVNFSAQVQNRDEIIIDLLLNTLSNDKSAHVRLAAVESLRRWMNEELVQASLIQALGKEEDPSVQILLIEMLSSLKTGNIAPHFDNLINDDNVPQFIKEEAHKGKFNLKLY